jgi:hypothetical protein
VAPTAGEESVELTPDGKADGDTSTELVLTPAKPSAKAVVRCTEWFACDLMVAASTDDMPANADRRTAKVTIKRSTDGVAFAFDATSVSCRNGYGPPIYDYMLPSGASPSVWCDQIVQQPYRWAQVSSKDPQEEFEITLANDRWESGLTQLTYSLSARWR